MKIQWRQSFLGCLLLASSAGAANRAAGSNPIEKIISLLTNLQGQLVADGNTEAQAFEHYQKYCSDASFNKKEEITASQAEKDMLEAEIAKSASDIKTSEGKIEDGSNAVAENEAKLKNAHIIRAKEENTFKASETELMSAMDMLGRAIDILTKEMNKGGAALLQSSAATQQLENVVMGLGAVIEGASLGGSEDLQKLTSMLQTRQDAEDGSDDQEGADPSKPYEGKSGGIIEVLQDLRDKAETQLRELRTSEAKSIQNFDLIKQSLTDETAQYNKELEADKISKSEGTKSKAVAEGSLAVVVKALKMGKSSYAHIQQDCMQKAADHQATVDGRAKELATLSKAKKLIQAQMGGGAAAAAASLEQTDDSGYTFIQMSSSNKRVAREKLAGQHVVALVQRLANQQKSDSLKQLASRIAAVIRYGLNGKSHAHDPFKKIKNLLNDMIAKLTREQQGDASEKEYCDKEMKKTKANQEDLSDDSEALKAKIDQAAAASIKLKSQVKDLQWDLSNLEKLVKQMTEARNEAHQVYLKEKDDLSKGLNSVRAGIHVLRDYYSVDKEEDSLIQTKTEDTEDDSEEDSEDNQQPKAPENFKKSTGAGGGIIGALEVVESDIANNLAELQTEEDDRVNGYQVEMQDSKVAKATKTADVSYMTKEYTALDKSVSELSSDAATTNEELSAVNEYFAKVKDRCVAKPEKYEDRKAKREQEIKGLEEAKSILESEGSSFLQKRK